MENDARTLYKNMLGTEKNFSLRYPLDIDRKTIDTGLIIHFLVNQHKGTYLPRFLMKMLCWLSSSLLALLRNMALKHLDGIELLLAEPFW